jgi:hypothetical protein
MHFVKSSLFCSLLRARKIENPEENADKTEYIMLELYMDPSNMASKFASHFIIISRTEKTMKWLMAYCEVETLITLKGLAGKSKMISTLLKGQALSYF